MFRKRELLKIWVLWIEVASAVQISENAIQGRQWPASLALFAGPPLAGTSNKKVIKSNTKQNPCKDNTEQYK
jgi:hypothetical protein